MDSSSTPNKGMRLDLFSQADYTPGASLAVQLLWYFLGAPLVRSYFLPFSFVKVWILRLFGATIGVGVRIKPGVKVKFPWRLRVGDFSWIGEDVWLDNLASITIGSNCCISQGVYLCTGSHNWRSPAFTLITKPILIGDSVWVAARTSVAPGAIIGEGAVITLQSAVSGEVPPWSVCSSDRAVVTTARKFGDAL